MELFIEAKNRSYKTIKEIINRIAADPEMVMKKEEIIKLLKKNDLDVTNSLLLSRLLNQVEGESLNILDEIDPDNELYALAIHEKINSEPFLMEKIWLKAILEDPKIYLFLSGAEVEKLRTKLEAYPHIHNEKNLIMQRNRDMDSLQVTEIQENMRVLIKALTEGKKISYSYQTKSGQVLHSKESIPYKLEYSLKDDIFYLLHYWEEEERLIKSIVKNFQNLRVTDKFFSAKPVEETIRKILKEKKADQPITIEIINEKNALERALYLFCPFETETKYFPEDNYHNLKVYYYYFDEEEVIARILSLGKRVKVLAPDRVREKLIETIRKSWEAYCDDNH